MTPTFVIVFVFSFSQLTTLQKCIAVTLITTVVLFMFNTTNVAFEDSTLEVNPFTSTMAIPNINIFT